MNSINSHLSHLLAAVRMQRKTAVEMAGSMEKLATGQRINRGADDPAGLITSENLRAVLASLDAETRSLERTTHVANTADAALGSMGDLLIQAEALVAANANSAGMSDAEREANQMQLDSIVSSINRIAQTTTFNGQKLFDGNMFLAAGGESIPLDAIDARHLGGIEIDSQPYALHDVTSGGALNTINGDFVEAGETVRAAREQINSLRARIGAFQKHTINARLSDISVTMENIASAESQIRDTDYARETANFARLHLLSEAALRHLGTVNSQAKNVLRLLG